MEELWTKLQRYRLFGPRERTSLRCFFDARRRKIRAYLWPFFETRLGIWVIRRVCLSRVTWARTAAESRGRTASRMTERASRIFRGGTKDPRDRVVAILFVHIYMRTYIHKQDTTSHLLMNRVFYDGGGRANGMSRLWDKYARAQ